MVKMIKIQGVVNYNNKLWNYIKDIKYMSRDKQKQTHIHYNLNIIILMIYLKD